MGLLAPRRKAPMFINLISAGLFMSSMGLHFCLFTPISVHAHTKWMNKTASSTPKITTEASYI
jgi:hypothetical protein